MRDDRELPMLLDEPSRRAVGTTYNGLPWCTLVEDGISSTTGESRSQGIFYLRCARPRSKHSLGGRHLELELLTGPVGVVAGLRGASGE